MNLSTAIRGERFTFADLREVFAKANEEKSGDQLAGIAARSERERVAAKLVLADLTLGEIVDQPLIDPDSDEVSRLMLETLDRRGVRRASRPDRRRVPRIPARRRRPASAELQRLHRAITPEIAAAVGQADEQQGPGPGREQDPQRHPLPQHHGRARRARHPRAAESSGRRHRRHPARRPSTVCSTAAATRSSASTRRRSRSRSSRAILHALDRLIDALRDPDAGLLPGAHHDAARRPGARRAGRSAVPVDRRHARRPTPASASTWRCCARGASACSNTTAAAMSPGSATHVMYFETGQGSALSAEAHHGVDQLTLEARAYGVARAFDPFLVNSVVGFIGPEYLVRRAADHPRRPGRPLHGQAARPADGRATSATPTTPTADQNSADNLLLLLAAAGLQLLHGRALRRRRDAQLPVDQLSRRGRRARLLGCGRRPSSPRGWRRAACPTAHPRRSTTAPPERRMLEQLAPVLERAECEPSGEVRTRS